MYHCHVRFYLTGCQRELFKNIKEMPPLTPFTHAFMESDTPEEALAANADVIFAILRDLDVKQALQTLTTAMNRETELIVAVDKDQAALLTDSLPDIKDIWILPVSEEELRFRFLRWQQTYKMSKDYWETSHFFESTINSIPNLIWYKDRDGIHEKVNDSFCETVNKTKKQVEGRGHAYIWDVEQDDPACVESELEVMTKEETCISEETIQTGDGIRLLTTYKSPLYDIDGSVMGTVGVAIDVTKERAYEKEIVTKNNTLERIFTTLDCGVMCHSIDGKRILSINRAALKILGYESQEELLAKGFAMVAPSVLDEDKPKLRKSIKTLKEEGDSISVEYRVLHEDGRLLHIMGNVKLIQENGELFYQRFLLDCTAQKLQQDRERTRQLELVHALSIDFNLVCFFDLETGMGNVLRLADEDHRMFGSIFSDNEISLRDSMENYIRQFVYEEDRKMMYEASSQERIRQELEKKSSYYVNYRILEDGEMKYFQMKVVQTGEWAERHAIVLGFRSVDEDIRREMEKKDLLEDALLQANRANRAKSAFLSNMSHDIRTPMNAIVGFTTLAVTHIDNKKQVEEYLKKIMTSGNHLLSLINDVLDMSRIESGKLHLEEKPCHLPDILQELRNIVQADAHAKQLELHIDTVDVLNEEIYCDKLRLNQVLLNLLGNSVKYTDAGGTVSMKLTEKKGAPKGYANYEFCIRDNGIGMSEEFVSRIFEPFEREENTTMSGIQGTGLGMAITKNIVDMMNGSIEVKSEQGVGTEFLVSFTFRLHSGAKEPQMVPELQNAGVLAAVDGRKKLRSGRILLAEDIDLNQEIAATILDEAGFSTEIADNGQIAVDMLEKSEPGYYQLVLMDIQMPVMNGYEAAKAIRRLENTELASIPIIAMTANAFEEDKQEAIKSGMNGHIAKPIDIANLFETLDRILAHKY